MVDAIIVEFCFGSNNEHKDTKLMFVPEPKNSVYIIRIKFKTGALSNDL